MEVYLLSTSLRMYLFLTSQLQAPYLYAALLFLGIQWLFSFFSFFFCGTPTGYNCTAETLAFSYLE